MLHWFAYYVLPGMITGTFLFVLNTWQTRVLRRLTESQTAELKHHLTEGVGGDGISGRPGDDGDRGGASGSRGRKR